MHVTSDNHFLPKYANWHFMKPLLSILLLMIWHLSPAQQLSSDRLAATLEFHYNNAGVDTNEYIEIQQSIGSDIPRFDEILFYDGGDVLYKTLSISEMQIMQGSIFYYVFKSLESGFADKGKFEVRGNGIILQKVSYNTESVTIHDFYSLTPSPAIKHFTVGESELTQPGTSLTVCGTTYGYNSNNNLNLISLPITIATVNACTMVPVTLISFNYRSLENNVVELNWETADEINSDQFIVERSKDGIRFETIGTLKAKGQSSIITHYQFKDAQPAAINYYRLKQTDKNGQFLYSKTLLVKTDKANPLYLLQNPVSDKLIVHVQQPARSLQTLAVYDITGKKILETKAQEGQQTIAVNHLIQGQYVLRLTTTSGTVYLKQFIKLP